MALIQDTIWIYIFIYIQHNDQNVEPQTWPFLFPKHSPHSDDGRTYLVTTEPRRSERTKKLFELFELFFLVVSWMEIQVARVCWISVEFFRFSNETTHG